MLQTTDTVTDDTVTDSTTASVPRPLSLRRNFSWTFFGNVVYAACQWGMLTVLAKLGNPEMVGQFALALAITAPVMLFASLALRQIQATDARSQFTFNDYLSLRLITTALALVVIAGVAFMSGMSPATTNVVLVVGFVKSVDAISDVIFGLFQQQELMDRIAKAMMINGVVSVVALSLGFYLTRSVFVGVLGSAIGSLATLIFYNLPAAGTILTGESQRNIEYGSELLRLFVPRASRSKIRELAWLALPLGPVVMLISLNSNIPRYFIEHWQGSHALGIFAALAYLIVAGTTVVSALGQSASPRLAKYYASGRTEEFRALLLKLVLIGLAGGVIGLLVVAVAGRQVLTLLYTSEYAHDIDVMMALALVAGLTFAASFVGYGITATRRFRIQLPLFSGVAIVQVLACALLIPSFGLMGAALATGASALAQLIGSTFIVRNALAAGASSAHPMRFISGVDRSR